MKEYQTYLQVTMTIVLVVLLVIVSLMFNNQMRIESKVKQLKTEISKTVTNMENQRRTSLEIYTRKD